MSINLVLTVMRCKLLLQHYARFQEEPTARVREVGGGATAKNAYHVKGVTLKRKLCQIQIAQIQKIKSSLIIFQTTLTDLKKYENFIAANSEGKGLPPPPNHWKGWIYTQCRVGHLVTSFGATKPPAYPEDGDRVSSQNVRNLHNLT
jgi:hypothetical protein